ncbi:hypothetical protein MEG1DRAFT_04278 [Photorhabdus temperata subsp. temperata Meg1]|uniref:Uncharacterized protein n=3 Tax=Photorhabdus temperata TaxID=574560 RepID=A0A081RR10_PHOTE|nr:hypothetical protein B738_24422 [Photorhabdus temperata subsp. temperata M1021]ERT13049.1 hypothetical protein O185_10890 [Photorhabdus temperata J3]KER01113.1 hypothetical protein MEG1DRAFT_04278 [Photorhabdus temperata subsp. temperata Meg1]
MGIVGVLLFSAWLTACPEIPESGFAFLKFIMAWLMLLSSFSLLRNGFIKWDLRAGGAQEKVERLLKLLVIEGLSSWSG